MKIWAIGIGIVFLVFVTYVWHQNRKSNHDVRMTDVQKYDGYAEATFSGGCFWCSESDFEKTDGVVEVISGYAGGTMENPSYGEVSSGKTGHREAVRVYYNPTIISYEQLLQVFWRHIDPTDGSGQFNDRGEQYAAAIYYHDDDQRISAEKSRMNLESAKKFDRPIVTAIEPLTKFFVAEDYHQDYYKKNKNTYEFYRSHSGRDQYIAHTWGDTLHAVQKHRTCTIQNGVSICNGSSFNKPADMEIKKILNEMQYDVTQNGATEKPFDNAYWDNEEEGIYVDIVSGEPLFSSKDKYDSGTGWPSFVKPIDNDVVVEKVDHGLHLPRIEIRSKQADSHLGHVFNDGPSDRGGRRYCMNSAALRFVKKMEMEKEGYGVYKFLFE